MDKRKIGKKILRDYPLNEWMEAADGCDYCGAKYQVRVTWIDEDGKFGDVEYRISHREDCPELLDLDGHWSSDFAGWEFMDKPVNFRGLELYPLKSRANVGPCLFCQKLVIGVPLILFIDQGKGGELDFCASCFEKLGLVKLLVKGGK